ncbi:unnamed protein product [Lactuca virosa]|uniref:Uncharacterized protein n=1 Tax=Lactuca virosa TaxID=75947 RepID=A0AAU9P9K5_9ASTR|nr:unnamed protein product [Lactuca virosa]
MGFGSLLGMKMIDVPLKIVYYVLDHFNFESLKVEFDNCEVSVDSTDGCLNHKLVQDDVNLNLTGIDDGTVNLGEDDHKNKDGENVEDCSNKTKDSNETRSLKNDIVPSFSLGFSQILKRVIPNVDVIDASPVSFAPPLGTLEGPSKPVSGKPKDINEEATSLVDIKGKRQMKFSYVYKSPFKERLIDFKPSLTQVENVVCEWLFNLQGNPGDIVLPMETDVIGFRANYENLFKKTHLHVSVLDSWSRTKSSREFRDVVNSPLRLFMNSDTICSKDLLCSMEIIFLSNGGRVLGVSYNLYENLARNMKNKNLGKWGT